jgi:RimJ/RimL family protein N-acetyltransferase
MERLFRLIKKNAPFVWQILENINGIYILFFMKKRIYNLNRCILSSQIPNSFNVQIKKCNIEDIHILYNYFSCMDDNDKVFFRPFPFSKNSLSHILKNASYLFYFVQSENKICGIFFLRIFFNKKAFLGFFVNRESRGRGLGKMIVNILVTASKNVALLLFSTVNKDNISSWIVHLKSGFKIETLLENNYFLLRSE